MAIGRARNRRHLQRYELFLELAQSHLGSLWAARVGSGDGAGTVALVRDISFPDATPDTMSILREAAGRAVDITGEGILPALEIVEEGHSLGLVYDYTEGDSLRVVQSLSAVRRKPMPLPIALRVGTDLLRAIVTVHRSVAPVYGGVSPDSILVGTDGSTRLLDVGLGSFVSRVERFSQHPERVSYAAPEQLDGRRTADPRTDVFAVGVLLWEMLSNRRLFIGSDQAVAQKVLAAKIPRLDEVKRRGDFEIPKLVVALVDRALSRSVDARFPTAHEMLEAIGSADLAAPSEVTAYVEGVAEGTLERRREAIRDEVGGKPPAALSASLRPMKRASAVATPGPKLEKIKPPAQAAGVVAPRAQTLKAQPAPPERALKSTQLGMAARAPGRAGVVVKGAARGPGNAAANAAAPKLPAAAALSPVGTLAPTATPLPNAGHRPRMKTMMGLPMAPLQTDAPAAPAVAQARAPEPAAPTREEPKAPVDELPIPRSPRAGPLDGIPDSIDEETVRIQLPMMALRAEAAARRTEVVAAPRSAATGATPERATTPAPKMLDADPPSGPPTSTELKLRDALSREADTMDDFEAESPPLTAQLVEEAAPASVELLSNLPAPDASRGADGTEEPRPQEAPTMPEIADPRPQAAPTPKSPELAEAPRPAVKPSEPMEAASPKFSEAPPAARRIPANPSAPPPSLFPSKVPPPLIHDPRTNFRGQEPTRRAPTQRSGRRALLFAVTGLLVVAAGVVLGRAIIEHRQQITPVTEEERPGVSAGAAKQAEPNAPAVVPAPSPPSTTVEAPSPAASATASAGPSEPAVASADAVEPAPTSEPLEPAATAPPSVSGTPTAAPAPRPARPFIPRKKKSYVPDDI